MVEPAWRAGGSKICQGVVDMSLAMGYGAG